jgi:hypothetical protein
VDVVTSGAPAVRSFGLTKRFGASVRANHWLRGLSIFSTSPLAVFSRRDIVTA